MASPTRETQLARQVQQSTSVRRIALELYRAACGRDDAELAELTFEDQKVYERTATFAMLLSSEDALRPAVYAAADSLTPGGIGRLSFPQRACAVTGFIQAYCVMKAALNGELHPDTAELMRTLVARDRAAGINGQPVNTKPAVNLADLDTVGVQ